MNMDKHAIMVAVGALLVGGVLGYVMASAGGDRHYKHDKMYGDKEDKGQYQDRSDDEHMSDAHHMMHDMTVSSEQEFVANMIPHHQEAVDTAQEIIERGGTTDAMRALAQNIASTQAEEVELLKQWHEAWYGAPYTGVDYTPMMRELTDLSGTLLDRAFLADMIPHHQGAIMMAQSAQPFIERQEAAEFAQSILETQAEEIELMKELLGEKTPAQ